MNTGILRVLTTIALASLALSGCREKKQNGASPRPGPTTRPAALSPAAAATDAIDKAHAATAGKLINRGIGCLLARRERDGAWSLGQGAQKPAATGLVLKALLQHPDFDARHPIVRKGFESMLRYRQDDGGIYNPKIGYANYTSSIALMALTSAADPAFNETIRELISYLKSAQITAGSVSPKGKKIGPGHRWIGGSSYGRKHNRPDGANTAMWTQALHEAGVPADDPAMQRMVGFFSRLQNRSESNPAGWVREGPNDGGFIYALGLTGPESKAGPGPGGRGMRSYGSITYMGFLSMLYAGLSKADPRVKAAYQWIRRHWTLEQNPNMPENAGQGSRQGLYFYYSVLARALRAWGRPIITDTAGRKHNWRHELVDALAKRIRQDGSWVNPSDRWNEGSPVLVTTYCVLALEEVLKK